MNKQNFGFTLVELLAVIVILGFISVIVVPSINKIITESKRATFESKARGIVRASEYEFKRLEMIGDLPPEIIFFFEDGIETSNVEGAILEYEGEKVKNGIVKINNDGQVGLAIFNEDWCGIKKINANDIIITEFINKENCEM